MVCSNANISKHFQVFVLSIENPAFGAGNAILTIAASEGLDVKGHGLLV